MSLLDDNGLINVKVYYKYINTGSGKKVVIIDNTKAEELLKDEEKGKGIEIFETEWRMFNWKEQNDVSKVSQSVNIKTGEMQFDYFIYRDQCIKKCLKKWNLTENGNPAPITSENIDRLPGPIVIDMYQRFESISEYSEEEMGN
jgi:hypothetical protein